MKNKVLARRFRKSISGLGILLMVIILSSCGHQGHQADYHNKSYVQLEAEDQEMYESENQNTEEYDRIYENQFKDALNNPLSTFSIDVDNASYSNVRRFLNNNQLPPKDAIRIEEMINYFSYDYQEPTGRHPFSIETEVAACPWNTDNKLVQIGIQGKSLDYDELHPCNFVFLIDASGSMNARNKLPLLKKSLSLLLNELSSKDKIAIVAYAGSAGLVLPSTSADNRRVILNALNNIDAGGSTAGGQGIQLAYNIAKENRIESGNNRVILATDGDFNVGVSSTGALIRLIEEKRKDDIYLTICGFGMGNYKDGRMEQISNAGNGNYFYIDNNKEAKKVFVTEMRANMFTIAKDVKIQVEFNPKAVKSYRLIGYENRLLADEDFQDDTKDAGELGAGHTVTALYEIIPFDGTAGTSTNLKYQERSIALASDEDLLTVDFRYKPLNKAQSNLISHTIENKNNSFKRSSDNLKFSAAVASFGMLLRDSEFKGTATYKDIINWSEQARGKDKEGHRAEFTDLVEIAGNLYEPME